MTLPRKFLGLSAREIALVLEASVVLVGVRVALAVLPFTKVRDIVTRTALRGRETSSLVYEEARPVVWAVRAAARRLLGKDTCLIQAVALEWMFVRRGFPAVLRIGVAKDDENQLRAHAWVESDGQVVIGGRSSLIAYHAFPPIR